MKKKHIHFLSFFFCFVLLQNSALSMNIPAHSSGMAPVDQDEAEQVIRKAIFLIEENGQENTSPRLEFVARQLQQALTSEAACIFVSKFTLKAYLDLMSSWDDDAHPEKAELCKQFNLYKQKWQLYGLDGTGYFLLIPKKYKTLLKNNLKAPHTDVALGLNIHGAHITKYDRLPQGSHTLTTTPSRRLSYLRSVADAAPKPSFESINFSDIFRGHAKHCPWVFYMAGHGVVGKEAVGLTLETLNQFFIDINQLTRILSVHLNSCFVGGTTRTYFEAADYDFHLTLGSSGNRIAFIDDKTPIDFARFFTSIEDGYKLKTPSLDYLTHATEALTLSGADEVRSVHPHMWSTPLARRRGEQAFSPISPSSLVRSLASSGNQPINNTSIALLSKTTTLIRDELSIFPTPATKLSLTSEKLQHIKQAHWLQFLTAADLLHKCKSPWTSWQKYPAIQALYDDCTRQQQSCREKHDAFLEAITQFVSEEYLYPAFTSLHHTPISDYKKPKRLDRTTTPRCQGRLQLNVSDSDEEDDGYLQRRTSLSSSAPLDAEVIDVPARTIRTRPTDLPFESHYFEKIVAVNKDAHEDTLPHHGVLSFLRDALFDILSKTGRGLFLIRTLQGNNDINLTLELCRYARRTSNNSSLEEWLNHHLNQQIYLEYLSAYTNNDAGDPNSFEICIAFMVGRRGWRLQFKGNSQRLDKKEVWNFVELTQAEITEHLKKFNERRAWLEEEHSTTLI